MVIEERREVERLERRKTILQAAFELYGDEGYLATTMDKTAERADLSRATLGIMNRAEKQGDSIDGN